MYSYFSFLITFQYKLKKEKKLLCKCKYLTFNLNKKRKWENTLKKKILTENLDQTLFWPTSPMGLNSLHSNLKKKFVFLICTFGELITHYITDSKHSVNCNFSLQLNVYSTNVRLNVALLLNISMSKMVIFLPISEDGRVNLSENILGF